MKVQCFGSRELGHIKRLCPHIKGKQRASTAEIDEPSMKRLRSSHSLDSEFLLLLALSGTLHTSRDTWLIDSGASRHMIRYGDHLLDVVQREFWEKVVLGDHSMPSCRSGEYISKYSPFKPTCMAPNSVK